MLHPFPQLLLAALTALGFALPAAGAQTNSACTVCCQSHHEHLDLEPAPSGRAKLFALLWKMFAGRVEGYIRSGVRTSEGAFDADDAIQEVWLRAWRRFDPTHLAPQAFLGSVLTIASLVLLEHWRRKARCRTQGLADLESDPQVVAASTPVGDSSTLKNLLAQETLGMVQGLLTVLPQRERDVVQLHLFEGLSMAAIGHRLQISKAAATKRWQRGLERMREDPRWTGLAES